MNLKTIGKNTIIYAIGNVCLRASSFLLIPIYTHRMTIDEFGAFANLLITIQMMVFVISVGAQTGLIRYLQTFEQEGKTGELIGSTFLLTLGSSVLVTIFSCTMLSGFFSRILEQPDVDRLIFFTCMAATVQAICVEMLAYYRARDEAVQFVLISFVNIPLLIGFTVYFLYVKNGGVLGSLYAYGISYAILACVLLLRIFPKIGFSVSWNAIKTMLWFGFPMIISMVSWVVIGGSAIYFLSYYASLESAAVYSLGQKFGQIANIILLFPFQLAYEPVVFANMANDHVKEKISSIITYFIIAFLITATGILSGTRLILPFVAPPQYTDVFIIVLFMMPSVLFQGLYSFGATLIQIANKTYLLGIGSFCFMAGSLLLNYILIPQYGSAGALVSLNIIFMLAGLLALLVGIKNYPIAIDLRRIVLLATAFIVILLIFFLVRNAAMLTFIGTFFLLMGLIVSFLLWPGFLTNQERAFFGRFFLKLSWR